MQFANPFVFILQFCLIQLYPSSNGDTGWLSINGTALILNRRVLHVLGLLKGISPRKTTSALLVFGLAFFGLLELASRALLNPPGCCSTVVTSHAPFGTTPSFECRSSPFHIDDMDTYSARIGYIASSLPARL
ncbi:hypothetical protein MRX96_000777 [Rhipicephalus microplus]